MRFSYNPNSGEISAYVKREEFELAARGDEYKVFSRQFDRDNLPDFIEKYCTFMRDILNHIYDGEEVKDIITISTMNSGYSWTSLLNLEVSDEMNTFIETLLGYVLHTTEKSVVENDDEKHLVDFMSLQDKAKLSLIMTLVEMLNLPQPFNEKYNKKKKNADVRIKEINKKLKAFEDKFRFSSEEMWKYYQDDELPDEDMSEWISLYGDKLFLQSLKQKEKIANELLQKWIEAT